jgi:DNA-binding LacI/PurR family transcriptional regulator
MGRIAMGMLLDEIGGAGAQHTNRDRQIILPSELVIRNTTAPID